MQSAHSIADLMDVIIVDFRLKIPVERIAPVIAGTRAVCALAIGQLEQKIV